jgi:hypothetical protein
LILAVSISFSSRSVLMVPKEMQREPELFWWHALHLRPPSFMMKWYMTSSLTGFLQVMHLSRTGSYPVSLRRRISKKRINASEQAPASMRPRKFSSNLNRSTFFLPSSVNLSTSSVRYEESRVL